MVFAFSLDLKSCSDENLSWFHVRLKHDFISREKYCKEINGAVHGYLD